MGAPREPMTPTRFGLGLALVWTLGCSSGATSVDAASADASEAGAGATAGTCQSVRMCAFDCGADDACVQSCRAKGTGAAQAAFDALAACTARGCAKGDVNCACGEQCLADGDCLSAVDACLGDVSDAICDNLCH